jgi:hypothetical protein
MADLPVLASSRALGLSRAERRAAKEIATTRAAGNLLAARQAVRLDVIADVASVALVNASAVSSLEAALVMRTPHAAGRLGFIADSACVSMAQVVARTGRSL